jgi:hypothetical protein
MQSIFPGIRRGVALAMLLVVIVAPAVYADEPIPEDPQAKIRPPIGLTSQEARINPLGGRTKSQGRINPPTGVTSPEPSWFELFAEWLRAQARIHPPVD